MSIIDQVPGPYEDTTCQMIAVYGDPSHRHLQTIRLFRDSVLRENVIGRYIVRLYYELTPIFADLAKKNSILRASIFLFSVLPAYILSKAWKELT